MNLTYDAISHGKVSCVIYCEDSHVKETIEDALSACNKNNEIFSLFFRTIRNAFVSFMRSLSWLTGESVRPKFFYFAIKLIKVSSSKKSSTSNWKMYRQKTKKNLKKDKKLFSNMTIEEKKYRITMFRFS